MSLPLPEPTLALRSNDSITKSAALGHSQDMLPSKLPSATAGDPAQPQGAWTAPEVEGAQPLDLATIYDAHFAFVWRSARRLGVDLHALDDVVQEVFLVVHRKLVEFEGRSTIRSWLFAITRRVAGDQRRRQQRKSAELLDHDPHDPEAHAPDERTLLHEQARLLHALLETLDDEKREAFVLAELEQMSGREIADALQLNLNTAYARIRAARQAFEAALNRHEARTRDQRRAP